MQTIIYQPYCNEHKIRYRAASSQGRWKHVDAPHPPQTKKKMATLETSPSQRQHYFSPGFLELSFNSLVAPAARCNGRNSHSSRPFHPPLFTASQRDSSNQSPHQPPLPTNVYSSLRILQFNVNGLRKKADELRKFLVKHKIHITGLQETELARSSKAPVFPG